MSNTSNLRGEPIVLRHIDVQLQDDLQDAARHWLSHAWGSMGISATFFEFDEAESCSFASSESLDRPTALRISEERESPIIERQRLPIAVYCNPTVEARLLVDELWKLRHVSASTQAQMILAHSSEEHLRALLNWMLLMKSKALTGHVQIRLASEPQQNWEPRHVFDISESSSEWREEWWWQVEQNTKKRRPRRLSYEG